MIVILALNFELAQKIFKSNCAQIVPEVFTQSPVLQMVAPFTIHFNRQSIDNCNYDVFMLVGFDSRIRLPNMQPKMYTDFTFCSVLWF